MPIPRPGPIVPANAKPGGRPTAPPPRTPFRPTTPNKSFTPVRWDSTNIGEKIIINGRSGMGKTSLATLLPGVVFMGIDRGGKNIRHPVTDEKLMVIPNVETFEDVRAGLRAMIDTDHQFVVIDTINMAEKLGLAWTLQKVPGPNGSVATDIESYGFGKGYRYLFDTMSLPLLELDQLAEAGKHVVLLSQPADNRVANASGEDYLCHGLGLAHRANASVAGLYTEWADHIFKIDYQNLSVVKANVKATKGKAVGNTERAIYTDGEVHFIAKSRQLADGSFMPPVVAFKDRTDDSVWQFMFKHLY